MNGVQFPDVTAILHNTSSPNLGPTNLLSKGNRGFLCEMYICRGLRRNTDAEKRAWRYSFVPKQIFMEVRSFRNEQITGAADVLGIH
jgi:hypothetical protein